MEGIVKLNKKTTLERIIRYLMILSLLPIGIFTQEAQQSDHNQDSLISAAEELMLEARYCALITLDETGHPQARTMDPFPPDSNMVVWFGTNLNSRKVKEIKKNQKATLYYEAPNAGGYVILKGDAYIENDSEQKIKYWKSEWEVFYPKSKENYTLIKFIPVRLEIVDYTRKIVGDSVTWEVPSIDLE